MFMSDKNERFGWILALARVWIVGALALLALAMAGTIAKAYVDYAGNLRDVLPYALAVLAELVLAVWVFVVFGVLRLLVSSEFSLFRGIGLLERIETLHDEQVATAKKLADLSSLTDQAKSLLFRDREMDAFREAIREDIMRQDFTAAMMLVENIKTKFGYADEAADLQDEIEASRKKTIAERIDGAVERVNQYMAEKDWGKAAREAQRLNRIFPDINKISVLPGKIEDSRVQHKRDLLSAYGEAVRKNDIDGGIELLRELDKYLSPQEAAALQESARGVFRAKLHNMGVVFAIKVTEENWTQAISIGEEIIREFPNTRIAHEVREKMDMLRSKASGGVKNNIG
jgi:hypothetical protein